MLHPICPSYAIPQWSLILTYNTATADVYSFGKGQSGRLGHGDEADVIAPPKVIEGLLGKGTRTFIPVAHMHMYCAHVRMHIHARAHLHRRSRAFT